MISGIAAKETNIHFLKFLGPVAGERFDAFVRDAPHPLVAKQSPEVRTQRKFSGAFGNSALKRGDAVAETIVDEPNRPSLPCSHRTTSFRQRNRRCRTDTARQGIGPIFR